MAVKGNMVQFRANEEAQRVFRHYVTTTGEFPQQVLARLMKAEYDRLNTETEEEPGK